MMPLAIPILSYLIGSVPTGYIVTKVLTGKDLREYGSGNVGGLNTYRVVSREMNKVYGILAGSFVALVDASKAIIAYLASLALDPQLSAVSPFFAILGHNYPIWLGFKGGRGIASLLGLFLYLYPPAFLVFLAVQGVIYIATKRFATGAMFSLLTTLPILHIITGSTFFALGLAELPVWMRYREKYQLWKEGRLGVNM